MHLNRTEYAAVLVLLTTFAVTGYGFTALSGEIAVHFDATGEPDDYMHVVPGLLLLPFLATALLVLFHYLPRIDPLGEN